ncbi:MAG: tRNA (adenosine(37)-N6)-threonylcarbamoyltransferase complex ATPase subunit type 1 TsaE [Taibaiella sp.]|nr:tRNA (adenosine(37)-N6)-threonylcarbamoyltransferase complex ATPase subunit type 1 TsaE [Taibaiella sp.]
MEKIFTLQQIGETAAWLWDRAKNYSVWTLAGEMGAGKTTLTAALMSLLHAEDEISSPTYSIINEYKLSGEAGYTKVYHADLYRLNHLEEAIDAGIEDMLLDDGALRIIEWPQIIQSILPANVLSLTLSIVDAQTRLLKINH